jgi:DNA-binding HxlR family transcriptional regulator
MKSSYPQDCPVARTLEIVGERWTLLILRDLVVKGPQRFQDLEMGLAGVAPNTLSARLKTLEEEGVIETRLYETHPPRYEYLLTAKGQALGPVLKALRDWGEHHTQEGATDHLPNPDVALLRKDERRSTSAKHRRSSKRA